MARSKSIPWYKRGSLWLQIVTCLGVLSSIGWSWFSYVKIDKPNVLHTNTDIGRIKQDMALNARRFAETEANTRSLNANARALNANVEQIQSQIELANATVKDMSDPVRKRISVVELGTAELSQAKVVDDLLLALSPDVRIQDKDIYFSEKTILFAHVLKNAGLRPIRLVKVSVDSNISPAPGVNVPKKGEWKIEVCETTSLAPGESLLCQIRLSTQASFAGVRRVTYKMEISAETAQLQESEVANELKRIIPVETIRRRSRKEVILQREVELGQPGLQRVEDFLKHD